MWLAITVNALARGHTAVCTICIEMSRTWALPASGSAASCSARMRRSGLDLRSAQNTCRCGAEQ